MAPTNSERERRRELMRQRTQSCPHGLLKVTAQTADNADNGVEKTCSRSNMLNMQEEQERDQDLMAEFRVFSWLTWSPPVDSKLGQALHHHFPGALPGHAVHERSRYELEQSFGFSPGNTLFGLSICPDEINYGKDTLASRMRAYWGEMFPLGGIGGAPFAGKTGYAAFAAHVPENGNILVVFGPHVGISDEGEVGACLRDGQKKSSSACGAVIGAYRSCMCGGSPAASEELDEMGWIKKQLAPHAPRIQKEENPMAALAHQAYHMVREKVQKVVNTNLHSGYVVLIGGIQINLPKPFEDHFMPVMFEVHRQGALVDDLLSSLRCPIS